MVGSGDAVVGGSGRLGTLLGPEETDRGAGLLPVGGGLASALEGIFPLVWWLFLRGGTGLLSYRLRLSPSLFCGVGCGVWWRVGWLAVCCL